jgi:hypothetical protein
VTIPVYGAASLRQTVGFPALIEPLRVAFGEYSRGRAQQVMSALWPGLELEDGNVLIKAGCTVGRFCRPASVGWAPCLPMICPLWSSAFPGRCVISSWPRS